LMKPQTLMKSLLSGLDISDDPGMYCKDSVKF
jgi:hypothetical protein